ncbi:transglutaminase family protein, partial [Francisella tularensis subsp. holarctica]|uniref:transglutaminase family protein n=1 Tax=Francisella tularensis TaxID=263 RepID=UPI002381AC50
WKKHYKHDLVRWGTILHDKFFLVDYVSLVFKVVVLFINYKGYEFKLVWFVTFFEFRFHLFGMTTIDNMKFEIRAAIDT